MCPTGPICLPPCPRPCPALPHLKEISRAAHELATRINITPTCLPFSRPAFRRPAISRPLFSALPGLVCYSGLNRSNFENARISQYILSS